MPLIISSFGEEWLIQKLNQAKSLKTQNIPENVKEKILARIQDLPNWVLFPDFERSEWFNKFLHQLWPSIEGLVISKVIKKSL